MPADKQSTISHGNAEVAEKFIDSSSLNRMYVQLTFPIFVRPAFARISAKANGQMQKYNET